MEGTKVRLRAVEPEDIDFIYQWENATNVWNISNTTTPYSKNTLRQYIDSIQDIFADKQLRLVIEEKKHGFPIGCIDLFDFDPKNRKAGVGILIADKSFEGKGFASESLALIKTYAFENLGLHQLYCNIITDNSRSIELFQKHQFEITGEKKDWILEENNWKNEFTLQCFNHSKL